jgi:hypothetical protein
MLDPITSQDLVSFPSCSYVLPQQQTTTIDSPEESNKVRQKTSISPEDRTSMITTEEVAPDESEPAIQKSRTINKNRYKNIAVNKGKDIIMIWRYCMNLLLFKPRPKLMIRS